MNKKYLFVNEIVDSVSITHKFNKPQLIFLNTSDIENGKILVKNYFSISDLKGQAKKTIKNGDILFSEIRPKNKRFAFVNLENPEEYVVSTKLMVLRNKNKEVNSLYFYYYLTDERMLSILQNRAENRICSFPQITFDVLSEYKVPVPNIGKQEKIVAILSSLDKKIELNNKINSELEAMAKTLYDYWFVQFDFPDANGKPYKSSGGKMVYSKELKREIPEGWTNDILMNLTTMIRRGISPKYAEDGSVLVLNQKCIRDQRVSFGESRRCSNGIHGEDPRIIMYGDILVNSTGVGTLGRVAYVKRKEEEFVTVDSHVTVVRGDQSLIDTHYLIYSLLALQKEIEKVGEGSTGQVELRREHLEKLNIIVPKEYIQDKFSEFLIPLIKRVSKNEQENQHLASLRDWLLPMLMNGQVGFKDIPD